MTPTYLAKFDMGDSIGLKAFFAAIIGGFNQTRGALLGGVLIGVLENVVGFYISPAYKEGVALMLFLVVILFRPKACSARPRSARYEQAHVKIALLVIAIAAFAVLPVVPQELRRHICARFSACT